MIATLGPLERGESAGQNGPSAAVDSVRRGEAVLERRTVVRVRDGLHARPATEFVKLARSFSADVEIVCRDKSANAKSAVKLMLLGVREADEITILADGEDAFAAIESLANFVSEDVPGEADDVECRPDPSPSPKLAGAGGDAVELRGAPASEGAALGPAFAFFPESIVASPRAISMAEVEEEINKLRRASLSVAKAIGERKKITETESESVKIIEALGEIAADPALLEKIEGIVRTGREAVSATIEAGEMLAAEFGALDDPYQRARAEDIRAVARQFALALLNKEDRSLSDAPEGAVILAEELSAFDLAGAAMGRIAGLVCTKGGPVSHIAIMARAHGVPAVLGLAADPVQLRSASVVGLNGTTGEVVLDPDEGASKRFRELIEDRAREQQVLQRYATIEPRVGGRVIEIAANIGSLKEIEAARAAGAMGVGLFRTEFLFMAGRRPPSEDEQATVYTRLAEAFAPWPVIIRTLDAGGDKPVPGVDFPSEDNPFLGWRGVRMCLERLDVFKPQLRALLRAAAAGNVKVMVPMVADANELRLTRELIVACENELAAERISHARAPLGAMIETPAAALLADEIAKSAEFFSIGTNDLTQYVMAADRLNPRVAYLNRPDHPAVLKAAAMACEAARRAGIWVGVCGEAAARPDLIPAFVNMGVDELSMSPSAILRAKKCVSEL